MDRTILNNSPEFLYSLLSRMQSDCEYFLNAGRCEKCLWITNVNKHIECMKMIYNHLENKPEWLTMEKIMEYEKEMTKQTA